MRVQHRATTRTHTQARPLLDIGGTLRFLFVPVSLQPKPRLEARALQTREGNQTPESGEEASGGGRGGDGGKQRQTPRTEQWRDRNKYLSRLPTNRRSFHVKNKKTKSFAAVSTVLTGSSDPEVRYPFHGFKFQNFGTFHCGHGAAGLSLRRLPTREWRGEECNSGFRRREEALRCCSTARGL